MGARNAHKTAKERETHVGVARYDEKSFGWDAGLENIYHFFA